MADRGVRVQPGQVQAMIGNINSPSVVSLNSACSSDGSAESHVVEPEEMVALTQELKRLKEALGRLKKVFANDNSTSSIIDNEKRKETRRVASHERLSEVLKILRQMLEKYPMLQSNEIVGSAEHLIQQVKNFDYEGDSSNPVFNNPVAQHLTQPMDGSTISNSLIAHSTSLAAAPGMASATHIASTTGEPPREFHDAIEALAHVFSNRVSEYIMGDLESVSVSSTTSSKTKSSENLTSGVAHGARPGNGMQQRQSHSNVNLGNFPGKEANVDNAEIGNIGVPGSLDHGNSGSQLIHPDFNNETPATEMLTPEQIDAVLMRHDQGVDHALMRAKIWSKYAKDVMNFVEKRTSLEMEWAKNLTRLAQTMRPILKEESYLPFQSIYCTALDQDLEMCATTQSTCSLLHGYKFAEPLAARRAEHEKLRKNLKDRWQKELKRIQEAVNNLNNARVLYKRRQQEYDRCREALRMAEQGAEIGATGENKVDKRKRLEEEALSKKLESESNYRASVDEANERHRNLLLVKSEVLQQVRELILQCDQTMKAVTVSYFHLQYTLTAPVPTQFQTLCESSRLYEPGFQFMEYVKRLPESQSAASQSHMSGGSHINTSAQPMNNGTSSVVTSDPFHFEPYVTEDLSGGRHGAGPLSDNRRHKYSLPHGDGHSGALGSEDQTDGNVKDLQTYRRVSNSDRFTGGQVGSSGGPMMAWTPSMSNIEPSDNESEKSGSASPSGGGGSHSPLIANPPRSASIPAEHQDVESFEYSAHTSSTSVYNRKHNLSEDEFVSRTKTISSNITSSQQESSRIEYSNKGVSSSSLNKRQLFSRAAVTHKFRKLKTPSKCRECDSYVYFQGYECHDCGLSSHKKCLETLALQCGHKRLPRRMTTFGVKLSDHLEETGAQVPPLVCKCVHNIDATGGIKVKGIYRVSGVKHKVEKLCQAFENGAELVDLTDQNPNVVANVLKLYMRQLPEPLLTFDLYQEFIRVAETYPPKAGENGSNGANDNNAQLNAEHEEEVIKELQKLCKRLPRSHLFLLGFLMHHLHRVASEYESNNMTASNLAIVFGPTLLRRNEDTTSMTQVLETIHQARAVELLTIYVQQIFGPGEKNLPKNYHKYTTNNHPAPSQYHPPPGSKFPSRPSQCKLRDGSGGSGSGDGDIISSTQELRHGKIVGDEYTLPGQASQGGGSADDLEIYGASISDDDEDPDPLPWESCKPLRPDDHVLPDHSSQSKLSPLLPDLRWRSGHSKGGPVKARDDKPKIEIKRVNLGSFSGLEGVSSLTLSTQDSTETSIAAKGSSATSTTKIPSTSTISSSSAAAPSSVSTTSSSINSSLSVTSNATTITKRSIQAEKSAPLTTSYSNLNSNTISPSNPMASSTSSSTLFMKVGKSTKKHSLDEDFIAGTTVTGVPHSSSSSHPNTTGDAVVGSVAFQGTLDISNYVDDSEDTTDTGSATSSTAGVNRGMTSGFPGRTASYHYSHGGNRSSGPNAASTHHQHTSSHYGSSQQYSESHSRMEGGSTSKSSLNLGSSLPPNSYSPKAGTDEAGATVAHLPPTAMTIASAEEHRKKMNALSSTIREGGKGSSTTSILGSGTGSASATIVNLEENKVKIKVPGLQQKSHPQHTSVTKQKSMNP